MQGLFRVPGDHKRMLEIAAAFDEVTTVPTLTIIYPHRACELVVTVWFVCAIHAQDPNYQVDPGEHAPNVASALKARSPPCTAP